MSFSKAKLQRFNDIHSCAPPPGAYNPKTNVNLPGATIPKSERFQTESPAGSIQSDNASVTSGNGSQFRTPTISKVKKTMAVSSSKITSSQLFLSPEESEALKEKIVECMNKDESIKELIFQVDELKDYINNLEVQQQQLNIENQQYENSLLLIENEHKELLAQLEEKYKLKIDEILDKESSANDELIRMKNQYAIIMQQDKEELLKLKDNIELLEKLQGDLKVEHQTAVENLEKPRKALEECYEGSLVALSELQRSHSEEINRLKKEHLLEIQDIEFEMLRCMTESQKSVEQNNTEILRLNDIIEQKNQIVLELNDRIVTITQDFEARLKQAEENSVEKIKLAEIQMEEKCKDIEANWTLKLEEQQKEADAILKECQAIGVCNIIQCEMEKNVIKQDLAEANDRIDESETMRKSQLQEIDEVKGQLSKVVVELNDTRESLHKKIDVQGANLDRAMNEKRSYEVSLNKALETVEALKNRLINSDKDVIQLKDELEIVERSKLDYEEKCNLLLEQLESVIKIKDELSKQNTNVSDFVQEKVQVVEKSLLQKLDDIQAAAQKDITLLKAHIVDKDDQIKCIFQQLKEQQMFNEESNDLLNASRMELDQLEQMNTELQFKESHLQCIVERLKNEVVESSDIHKKYIEQSGKIDSLQQQFEELKVTNAELEKAIAIRDALIGPFRKQLEEYEMEREALVTQKSEAQNELKEISLRHAQMLGHQNSKQKIKHVVDLKQKNLDLHNANREMELKLKSQNKLIEKLKKEVSDKNSQRNSPKMSRMQQCNDKENVSPLKQRNLF